MGEVRLSENDPADEVSVYPKPIERQGVSTCLKYSPREDYWICRYLPDENRNMMISRSSGRSGGDYYLIIFNMIICYSISLLSSPI